MALKGANGLWADYKQQSIIDTSKEYVFEIPDSPYITADKLFEYENLYDLPISLERKKSKQKVLVK